jgi:hypothetical protein
MFLFSQEEELEGHNVVSGNNEHALPPERRHRCYQTPPRGVLVETIHTYKSMHIKEIKHSSSAISIVWTSL